MTKLALTRRQLAAFLSDPDAIRTLEKMIEVCNVADARWDSVAASKNAMLVGQPWIEDIAVGANVVAPTGTGTYTLEFLTYGTNLSTAPASRTCIAEGNSGVQGTMAGGNGRIRWRRVA